MTPTINTLKGQTLVALYNAITGSAVKRFTNTKTALNRIRGAMAEAGMTEAQALAKIGMPVLSTPPVPQESAAAALGLGPQPTKADKRGKAMGDSGSQARAGLLASRKADAKAKAAKPVITSAERRAAGSPKAKAAGKAKAAAKVQDGAAKAPREGSKIQQVVTMLRAKGGATVPEIQAVTGWLPHTTRAAISAGIGKKMGLTIATEKVEGRGRVYRIAA